MRSFSDIIGFSLSCICAIQCIMLPFALSFAAMLPEWAHFGHSWPAISIIGIIAIWSFSRGYPQHKKNHIILLALLGYTCLVIGAVLETIDMYHNPWFFFVGGALMLMVAHWKNYRSSPCSINSH